MNGFTLADSHSIQWRKSTVALGIEVKNLGSSGGRSMQLVRFKPGTSFPLHAHTGLEFIYLKEGEPVQDGQSLLSGYAATAASATVNANYHSTTGCVFLAVYCD